MKIVLETPRLYCREFEPADGPLAYELNADPEVLRYTGDVAFESPEAATEFLRNYPDYRINGYGRWAVIRKQDHVFLGWCGLKLHPDGSVDIGYRFFKKYSNQGYATESAGACMEYGFTVLNLPEVIGRASHKNGASIRVFKKIGMQLWKSEACEGIEDSVIYRLQNSGTKKSP